MLTLFRGTGMVRAAFVLAAVLMMVFSASLGRSGLDQGRKEAPVVGQALFGGSLAADAVLGSSRQESPAFVDPLSSQPTDDQPAPALLVYGALVLLGSAAAVVVVRRSQAVEP